MEQKPSLHYNKLVLSVTLTITILLLMPNTTALNHTSQSIAVKEFFNDYNPNFDPIGWMDTGENNSLIERDELFKIVDINGDNVLSTFSNKTNIHSHYRPLQAHNLSSFNFQGKMMISDATGGVGITFFSQFPQEDVYYRIRRYGNNSFHLSPHGTSMTAGIFDSGVRPKPDVWYSFNVHVRVYGDHTSIQGTVWEDGTGTPDDWQINAYDSSPTRLTKGTIGVWSMSEGAKYWDDLSITADENEADLSSPFIFGANPKSGEEDLEPSSSIQVHISDLESGVDIFSIKMVVNGEAINPIIKGDPLDFSVTYNPPTPFQEGDQITVTLQACDRNIPPNCMENEAYSFYVKKASLIKRVPLFVLQVFSLITLTIFGLFVLIAYKANYILVRRLKAEPISDQGLLNLAKEVSHSMKHPTPRLLTIKSDMPNLFVLGKGLKDTYIIITSSALRILDEEEIKCVLKHQLFTARTAIFKSTVFALFAGLIYSLTSLALWLSLLLGFGDEKDPAPKLIYRFTQSLVSLHSAFIVNLLDNKARTIYADESVINDSNCKKRLSNILMKMGVGRYEVNPGHLPLMMLNPLPDEPFYSFFQTHPELSERLKKVSGEMNE